MVWCAARPNVSRTCGKVLENIELIAPNNEDTSMSVETRRARNVTGNFASNHILHIKWSKGAIRELHHLCVFNWFWQEQHGIQLPQTKKQKQNFAICPSSTNLGALHWVAPLSSDVCGKAPSTTTIKSFVLHKSREKIVWIEQWTPYVSFSIVVHLTRMEQTSFPVLASSPPSKQARYWCGNGHHKLRHWSR